MVLLKAKRDPRKYGMTAKIESKQHKTWRTPWIVCVKESHAWKIRLGIILSLRKLSENLPFLIHNILFVFMIMFNNNSDII